MLSTFAPLSVNSAKHDTAQRERPFAALRVTPKGCVMLSTFAPLSVNSAKQLSAQGETLRCAQGDTKGLCLVGETQPAFWRRRNCKANC